MFASKKELRRIEVDLEYLKNVVKSKEDKWKAEILESRLETAFKNIRYVSEKVDKEVLSLTDRMEALEKHLGLAYTSYAAGNRYDVLAIELPNVIGEA